MIKHFLNPPNWFTSASIFCSTYAMSLIIANPDPAPDVFSRACVLVIFGGVFDLLDGRVARLTGRYSQFGVQLDSIADMIGFGVAPALIAWAWSLQQLGPIGVAITFWYVLATAFRLARFNVAAEAESWPLTGHSQGLTSTMSGGALVTFVWVSNGYLHDVFKPSAWLMAGVVASLGLLMVSSVPYRNFKNLRASRAARRMLALFFASCLAAAVLFDPSMWWGVGALLYVGVGFIDGLVTAAHQRLLSRALMIDDLFEDMEIDDLDDEDEDETSGAAADP